MKRKDPIAHDTGSAPGLSEAARAAYDATPDDAIDYDDIPDMGDVDWGQATAKQVVAMRLDPDVITFFKQGDPKGYTGRMAAVLSAFARRHVRSQGR